MTFVDVCFTKLSFLQQRARTASARAPDCRWPRSATAPRARDGDRRGRPRRASPRLLFPKTRNIDRAIDHHLDPDSKWQPPTLARAYPAAFCMDDDARGVTEDGSMLSPGAPLGGWSLLFRPRRIDYGLSVPPYITYTVCSTLHS